MNEIGEREFLFRRISDLFSKNGEFLQAENAAKLISHQQVRQFVFDQILRDKNERSYLHNRL